ncbi:MAG: radical SAM protein [Planctomycetes bacterium]|nr:radical SAM protein [Planctomycetota bacterium]
MKQNRIVFSPPIEADSLFLKITRGCSYNACSFCGIYRDTPFQMRSYDEIQAEVEKVCQRYRDDVYRIVLGEGDALVADTSLQVKLLKLFKTEFPHLQQVGIYSTAQALLEKSSKELSDLYQAGLMNIYLGIESGLDKTLADLNKGVDSREILEACGKAKAAGFKLITMTMLGAGGRKEWRENAQATGRLLTEINPQSIILLTMVLVPETPIFEAARRGTYTLPTPVESVLELKELITYLDVSDTLFKSNHASNFLKVSGKLPRDKEKMLHHLERALNNPSEEFFDPGYFRGS